MSFYPLFRNILSSLFNYFTDGKEIFKCLGIMGQAEGLVSIGKWEISGKGKSKAQRFIYYPPVTTPMDNTQNTAERTYHLGQVDPSLQRWGNCDLLQHEGQATVYRNGMKFQAEYESRRLHIVGDVESDMLPTVEKLEFMIEQIRQAGDAEVQSMLPARK
jgi:hypothetical protein